MIILLFFFSYILFLLLFISFFFGLHRLREQISEEKNIKNWLFYTLGVKAQEGYYVVSFIFFNRKKGINERISNKKYFDGTAKENSNKQKSENITTNGKHHKKNPKIIIRIRNELKKHTRRKWCLKLVKISRTSILVFLWNLFFSRNLVKWKFLIYQLFEWI